MMYEEFIERAKRPITIDQYRYEVEPVYTYHPAIKSKDQCAALYDLIGIQAFRDMRETADKARIIEERLLSVRNEKECLERELKAMSGGDLV